MRDQSAHAFVGTSGWSYTSWKPVFYPAEVKSRDFLRYYGTRLNTLEINYTFNHLPTPKNISAWRDATPPEFLFALKASQQITHHRQLRDPAETLPLFFEPARRRSARGIPRLIAARSPLRARGARPVVVRRRGVRAAPYGARRARPRRGGEGAVPR